MCYLLLLLCSRLILDSISDLVVGPPFRCVCQKQERRIVRVKPCNTLFSALKVRIRKMRVYAGSCGGFVRSLGTCLRARGRRRAWIRPRTGASPRAVGWGSAASPGPGPGALHGISRYSCYACDLESEDDIDMVLIEPLFIFCFIFLTFNSFSFSHLCQ